jgi:hypothetical protein
VLSIPLLAAVWAIACGGIMRVDSDTSDGRGGAGSGTLGGGDGVSGTSPPIEHGTTTGVNAKPMGTSGFGTSSGGYANAGGAGYSTGIGGYVTTPGGGFPAAGGAVFGGVADAGGVDPSPSKCGGIASVADSIVPSVLVLLDRSASMSCAVAGGGNRWIAVKTGIEAFVQNAPGRSIGIEYFGADASDAGTSCNPADYETPDVEVESRSDSSQPIIDSLSRHGPGGGTPTAAALVGAYNHIIAQRKTGPTAGVAVVLVTDGEPDACGSAADVANAASVGNQTGITTFVIGLVDPGDVCTLNLDPANQKDLDAIARAGGSRSAFMVHLTNGAGTQLVDALSAVQVTPPLQCQYWIPQSPSIDPTKVDVEYTPSASARSIALQYVAGEASCDKAQGGWYYDDPKNPSEIDICPANCSMVDAPAKLNISFGCAPGRL